MEKIEKGIADIEKIRRILAAQTSNRIARETGITKSTIEKLKSGDRAVEKLNLAYAIRLTEYAIQQSAPVIEIWGRKPRKK